MECPIILLFIGTAPHNLNDDSTQGSGAETGSKAHQNGMNDAAHIAIFQDVLGKKSWQLSCKTYSNMHKRPHIARSISRTRIIMAPDAICMVFRVTEKVSEC
jgi:hypothetical protein